MEELLEAIELFKQADADTKASVVDLLKFEAQPDDSLQMSLEKVG